MRKLDWGAFSLGLRRGHTSSSWRGEVGEAAKGIPAATGPHRVAPSEWPRGCLPPGQGLTQAGPGKESSLDRPGLGLTGQTPTGRVLGCPGTPHRAQQTLLGSSGGTLFPQRVGGGLGP